MNVMNHIHRVPALLLFTAAATGFACADLGAQPARSEAAATVRMTGNLQFEPKVVEIRRGQTVVWRNASNLVHTATAAPDLAKDKSNVHLPSGAKPFHSGDIPPGGEYRHTFTVPGRYRYFCVPHEAMGMVGEVIVRE